MIPISLGYNFDVLEDPPGLQFKWIDDDGPLSPNDNDSVIPNIPSNTVAPINIQFQIISNNHTYFGAGGKTSQKEASENISLIGNALFTGSLDKIQGVSFLDNQTWNVPIIPTMSLYGGVIEITANWEGYGNIIQYLEIGRNNPILNGTIVTVTPDEFEIGSDQRFTVTVRYVDGSYVKSAKTYLYFIDDGEVATAGDPLEDHIICSDDNGFNGYYLDFNINQQRNNQTEAGFPDIKAPRNLSVYATTYIGGKQVYGWALVRMKPSNNINVTIKRGIRRSIHINIDNDGLVNENDITWDITVTRRGFFKRTIMGISGNISILEEGSSEKVFERAFGFSLIKVTVNVTGPCINPIEKTVKGFIFLRFIRLRRFFEFLNIN